MKLPDENNDALLGCLAIICQHLNRPYSLESLKSGLPVSSDGMNVALYIRAGERVGLRLTLVKKSLFQLTDYNLPCTLLLKNKKAVVLVALGKNSARIVDPDSKGESELNIKKLSEDYSGYALISKKIYEPDRQGGNAFEIENAHWFWSAIKSFRGIYGQVLLASFLINLFALVLPLFTMQVYDRVIPNQTFDTLWVLAIAVGIVYIFDFLLKAARNLFLDTAAKGADIMISSRLFCKLMALSLRDKPASSGVLAGNMREFETIREFFSAQSLLTLIDIPFIIIFLIIIGLIAPGVVWIPLVAIPVLVIGTFLLHRPLPEAIKKAFHESSQKSALLMESVLGLETIKIFRAEGAFQKRWEECTRRYSEHASTMESAGALSRYFAGFVTTVLLVAVVVFSVYEITQQNMSVGALIAVMLFTGRLMTPLASGIAMMVRYERVKESFRALDTFMKKTNERATHKHYEPRDVLQGHIEFKNVAFTYPGESTPALKNFNLVITPFEKVAIVGPIGSGKTTLQKLLLKLYEPQSGQVLLDGTDIRQLDPADIRKNMGVVPQDISLFYGSARDNIALGYPEVDEESIKKAAILAGVQDFLRLDQHGFDKRLGERGESLSGGQRQAIALARALVMDPPIYLMDEPTSAFDPAAETRFVKRFLSFAKKKTLLLITHRTTLLALCNRIVVLNQGEIVMDGARDAVLKKLKTGIKTS